MHDKEGLSQKYKRECGFNEADLMVIKKMKDLNNGKGGLRYDNIIIGEFDQQIFREACEIVKRTLEKASS